MDTTYSQIKKIVNDENLDSALKVLNRYGEIVLDNRWENKQGCYREKMYYLDGHIVTSVQHNGKCISLIF